MSDKQTFQPYTNRRNGIYGSKEIRKGPAKTGPEKAADAGKDPSPKGLMLPRMPLGSLREEPAAAWRRRPATPKTLGVFG